LFYVSELNNYIEKYKSKINDGYTWEFWLPEKPTTKIIENTKIEQIVIHVNYTFSNKNKIYGKLTKIKLLDNENYSVFLELNIETKKNIKNHAKEIEYWFSHEIHHAFRNIKTINKNSKSNKLNWVKNKTARTTSDFLQLNPPLKEFITMFYLALPQEVEARVQEVANQLKYDKKSKNPNETYIYLMRFQPLLDAKNMLNYSINDVKKVNKDILEKFINILNSSLKEKGLNTWIKKDIDSFFNFWHKKIIESGSKLQKNIDRVISDKYLYKNESEFFNNTDLNIISEVYGIDFGDIPH
jgi:hypothetical protein